MMRHLETSRAGVRQRFAPGGMMGYSGVREESPDTGAFIASPWLGLFVAGGATAVGAYALSRSESDASKIAFGFMTGASGLLALISLAEITNII